jgi:hypothetical protein
LQLAFGPEPHFNRRQQGRKGSICNRAGGIHALDRYRERGVILHCLLHKRVELLIVEHAPPGELLDLCGLIEALPFAIGRGGNIGHGLCGIFLEDRRHADGGQAIFRREVACRQHQCGAR